MSCANEELAKSAGEEKPVVEAYDSKYGTYKPAAAAAVEPSTGAGPKHDPKPF